jgi:hypothetical protein
LHGLPGDFDGYQNPLPLEPFSGQPVFVIRPFSFEYNSPWRGFQRDEREDTAPLRRMPTRGDGIR